jgi:hypothetical protein
MFHRIIVEDWQRGFSLVAFLIFFTVFLVVVIRALRMSRNNRQHLKNLPLDNDDAL